MKARVLVAHCRYRFRGGEDSVVDDEIDLLRAHGHDTLLYVRDNRDISKQSKLVSLGQTLWSRRSARDIDRIIGSFRPDIIHVHNTFPLISPSIYWAAYRNGVRVIQTLHNFRLFCVQAMFLRDGNLCEDCLGHLPWRGVAHRCYRDSYTQSAAATGMLTLHRALGSYENKVSCYIALNGFCRDLFVKGGLPAAKIRIKPNFVDIKDAGRLTASGKALFVGRLSLEKGLDVLSEAVSDYQSPVVDVLGTGPELERLGSNPALALHGVVSTEQVYRAMRSASFLVLPSICYENFPRTLVEAFACSLPVIASRLGALAELVEDSKTGLLFEPGSAGDLRWKMAWAGKHPDRMVEMGRNARRLYEENYTPEANYRLLCDIYENIRSVR